MKKLAIISTHPIQYNAPLFALMADNGLFELRVFYTWGEESIKPKYDPDFGREVEWDIPLLQGYQYQFVKNVAENPGSHHFFGIDNPGLIDNVESWGANIVWIWGWSFKSHLNAIRYFYGRIPVWFRGDSISLTKINGVKGVLRKVFLRWVYSHVDLAFYVGENNKNYYLEHGLKSSQLVLARHAVDNLRFQKTQVSNEMISAFRNQLGLLESDFVVLFAGKLEPRKNPFYLKEIWDNITSKNIKLLVVGNGPLELKLKDKCKNDERIVFLDFQNQTQMPRLYKSCNALILPSISETWGLAINEAMASGIPVLASEFCGGAIDLITKNTGFIFGLDEPVIVATIIEKFFNDQEFCNQLKITADQHIENFSYQKIIEIVNKQVLT